MLHFIYKLTHYLWVLRLVLTTIKNLHSVGQTWHDKCWKCVWWDIMMSLYHKCSSKAIGWVPEILFQSVVWSDSTFSIYYTEQCGIEPYCGCAGMLLKFITVPLATGVHRFSDPCADQVLLTLTVRLNALHLHGPVTLTLPSRPDPMTNAHSLGNAVNDRTHARKTSTNGNAN